MQLKFMALIFISVFIVAVIIVLKVSNRKPQPKTKTKKVKPKTFQQKKKRAGLLTGGTLAVGGLAGFFLYNTYGFIALLAITLVVAAIIITIINSAVGGIGSAITNFRKPKPKPRTIMDDDNVEEELRQQLDDANYVNEPATDPIYHSWVDAAEAEDEETEYDTPTGRTPI